MTSIDLFDYHLPEKLIAQRPALKREDSRLMVVDRAKGAVSHSMFKSLPEFLGPGDTLVINTTKVFPARLKGRRKTGGAVEILLIRRLVAGEWLAMARGAQKARPGEHIIVGDGEAELVEKMDGGMTVFRFESDAEVDRLTGQFGDVPLPPYIHRPDGRADEDDRARYQTVFASQSGSCAAPTAGLHFTDDIMEAIRKRGVNVVPLILHVGPGTFRPVKSEKIEDHVMDSEPYDIPKETADAVNAARSGGGRVVAVGSTVTRALESSADDNGLIKPGPGATSLYITPGYRFRAVDAVLTNFHLPKSTLLILVSAFAGRELVMNAYEEAVKNEYRFFSYGDAMLIV